MCKATPSKNKHKSISLLGTCLKGRGVCNACLRSPDLHRISLHTLKKLTRFEHNFALYHTDILYIYIYCKRYLLYGIVIFMVCATVYSQHRSIGK